MPVEFLTDDQARAYGTFPTEITRVELERFFYLDNFDLNQIALRRTDHHRLGYALQIGTMRCVGRFLEDPLDAPWAAVEYLAEQLEIADPSCVKRYTDRAQTVYDHAWEIRDAYGYHAFENREAGRRFRTFLHGRAWTQAEGPVALFGHSVAWLRRERVLLPGVTVLARLVAEVREKADARLHATVAGAARRTDRLLSATLTSLLEVPDGSRFSEWERLRRSPTRTSGPALVKALERVDDLAALKVGKVRVDQVPPNRMKTLARIGAGSKAPALARMHDPKRTAVLVAEARHLQAVAIDDALDLFALLMTARLFSPARRVSEGQRLAILPRLEKASKTVAAAGRILTSALAEAERTGEVLRPDRVWEAVEAQKKLTRQSVLDAIAVVEDLVPDDDGSADAAMRAALTGRYATVRPFLTLLGESQALGAASGGTRILAAVKALPELTKRKVSVKPLLPREIDKDLVSPAWKRAVYANPQLPEGAVDRDAYVVCVLEQLYRALGRRDVFATPSHRWSDPRARLLDGLAWEAVRADVLAGLSRDEPVDRHLAMKAIALDAAWKQMAQRLADAGDDTRVQVITPPGTGRARLSVQHMDALDEPESLKWLRATCQAMLPRVDLPELLLEVHAWTGFLDAYVHLADIFPRMEDLAVTVAALLVSEACNVGLTPVIKPGEPALTRGRLSHVDQYYVRAENHAAANTALVEAQGQVPITAWWGGGLLASVDGLRFVVPVRTINAGPSPKYFGYKRGITWLNAVNDQIAGIGQMVVPGTPRDSLYILDVLLNLDAGPRPDLVTADNASYSDMVHGVFAMLGYRFSPRYADLSDQRLWRADLPDRPNLPDGVVLSDEQKEIADYGPLEAIARNKVSLKKIAAQWPDMLRVAGSLVTNQVRAYDLMRMFGREGHPTPLGQGFAEYGRIDKTLHLLELLDPMDDGYLRRINRQLTVQESRHRLARKICHGERGQIRQKYREGQEDQLAALGLVVNAVVLWNSRYLDAAVAQLRAQGLPVRDEDVARLSPLGHAHVNCYLDTWQLSMRRARTLRVASCSKASRSVHSAVSCAAGLRIAKNDPSPSWRAPRCRLWTVGSVGSPGIRSRAFPGSAGLSLKASCTSLSSATSRRPTFV